MLDILAMIDAVNFCVWNWFTIFKILELLAPTIVLGAINYKRGFYLCRILIQTYKNKSPNLEEFYYAALYPEQNYLNSLHTKLKI